MGSSLTLLYTVVYAIWGVVLIIYSSVPINRELFIPYEDKCMVFKWSTFGE